MAKKVKVLEMSERIHLVCIKDFTVPINRYRLYLYYPAKDRYGYPTEHRKELSRYEDFQSVLYHVSDLFAENRIYLSPPTDSIIAWNNRYCGKA